MFSAILFLIIVPCVVEIIAFNIDVQQKPTEIAALKIFSEKNHEKENKNRRFHANIAMENFFFWWRINKNAIAIISMLMAQ